MASELICPRCAGIMFNYKENHYKCQCGARAVQLSLYDEEELTTTGEKENGELITKNTEKSE